MHRLSPFIAVLLVVGCRQPSPVDSVGLSEALSVDTTGFARAEPGYQFEFPGDHGAHPAFFLEWWYFTGTLETVEGEAVGYQFTIFRNALAPPSEGDELRAESEWLTDQLYSAHLAVSLPERSRFLSGERYARGAAGLGGAAADEDTVRVWVESWAMEAKPDLSAIRLRGGHDQAGLSLSLSPRKPIVLQGDAGYSTKGLEPGQASHYYSITRLDTEGWIRVGEDSLRVQGQSWLDREWSTSLLSRDQAGWDWFSLQLGDGRDLMLFRLRSSEGQDYQGGSLVGVDGERLAFDPGQAEFEVLDVWKSPSTGARYPTRWQIRLPDLDMDLRVEARMEAQELETRVRYWEGMVTMEGREGERPVQGSGYLEMTGYDR